MGVVQIGTRFLALVRISGVPQLCEQTYTGVLRHAIFRMFEWQIEKCSLGEVEFAILAQSNAGGSAA